MIEEQELAQRNFGSTSYNENRNRNASLNNLNRLLDSNGRLLHNPAAARVEEDK